MGAAGRVLVIEDDPAHSEFLADVLGAEGYEVTATASALGAAALARRLQPCAILLDLGLPYRSGASLLMDLKADPVVGSIPIIIVSGLTDVLAPHQAAAAFAILQKPFSSSSLIATVRDACQPRARA
jgi:DNA-binding response OmpR family regulator